MQIFILLSGQRVSISTAIYEGERSFKPPSTASRLILVRRLSFLYHHPPPRHLNSVPTTRKNTATSPSPLPRDVGSITNTPGSPPPHPPLPFRKGCGRAHTRSTGESGSGNHRGDPVNGRPVKCVPKTGYNICRSPFLSHCFLP